MPGEKPGAAGDIMREKIIFIHGISDQMTGYSNPLYNAAMLNLRKRLSSEYCDPAEVDKRLARFEQFEMMWADLTGPVVSKYLQTQYPPDRRGHWNFIKKRVEPLVVQLGVYAHDKAHNGLITKRINELFADALADKPDYITVIGHSLGSVIAWDYLFGFVDGFRLEPSVKVRAFITMGSPIPLFAAQTRHPVSDAVLPDNIGKWINLIDPDDGVAAYMRQAFPKISSDRLRDVEVSTGFWMISSHSGYWQSSDCANAIAKTLEG